VIDLRAIAAVARADFHERTRRYQYLAAIVVTIVAGTLLLPGRNAGYETFLIDGYRGIYNSAWTGATFALLAALLLSLLGFYNVKSAVARDRDTHTGEIVAATPVSRFDYAMGKASSNFGVLGSMAAVLFLVAIVMQFVRGESAAFDLRQIAFPFVLVVAPALALTASVALLFEVLPWLRGGFGNVVYFFGWIAALVWTFDGRALGVPWWRDPLGGNLILRQVWSSLTAIDPHAKPSSIEIGAGEAARRLFVFHGFAWSGADVAGRLAWLVVSLALVALAALLFDRFAKPARSAVRGTRGDLAFRWRIAAERWSRPLTDCVFRGNFGALVLAELRLLLGGLSFWWYLVAAGLFAAQFAVDTKTQSLVVGLAWIWPMLQWSQLGTRESVFATEQLIYPTVHPIRRQFVAQWLAGVVLALATAGGSLIHLTLAGNHSGVEGIVAGAFFVPTLALACGSLSGTTRLFEIVYLLLWYAGPMNRTTFDFTQGAYAPGYAIASCILFAAALAARRVRLAIA
jgi:hypothetical protein